MNLTQILWTLARLFPSSADRHGADTPEPITLGVRPGVIPSAKPAVHLFVGTEAAQYRAERVFVWSIEQVRDPGRVYKIYIMKNLAGFERQGGLTGFTNYRFAIPHFATSRGIQRAIYNDVDQVYLADPGQLFDTDLGAHGFVSISDRDTSVMLMDCARMATVWALQEAQHKRRKTIEAKATSLWGPLDPAWNARDEEYRLGRSKVLHYTTIHAQPWQPFPERYAYQRNPVAHVWFELERAADQAGYHTAGAPQMTDPHIGRDQRYLLPTPSPALGDPPSVWVLTADKPGHTSQALGLADALGWPYEEKRLAFTRTATTHKRLFGVRSATCIGLDRARSARLAAPWPDIVITAGWRPARVARWIRDHSQGKTRLVLLGRKGGHLTSRSDIVVSCGHFRQPPHPRRIETIAPLTLVTRQRLEAAAAEWRDILESAPHPRVAVLVGGATARYRFDPDTARQLGRAVRAFAHDIGASLFVTTSRRTGAQACHALQQALGPVQHMHVWQAGQPTNPYLAYLSLADVLIVTGESESMLAEAAATDKPLYVYPLPERSATLGIRLKEWLVRRAQQPRRNKRGTVRPQRGLAYVCGRLIERGTVQPRRDLNALHQALVQHGFAHFFGESFSLASRPRLQEFATVARQVRHLLKGER